MDFNLNCNVLSLIQCAVLNVNVKRFKVKCHQKRKRRENGGKMNDSTVPSYLSEEFQP